MASRREFLTEPEAAAYLGISHVCLKKHRLDGIGPTYIRLSPRLIRYEKQDLDEYIASCRISGARNG